MLTFADRKSLFGKSFPSTTEELRMIRTLKLHEIIQLY